MQPADTFAFHGLSGARLSPDGQYLLLKQTVVDWEDNRFRSQLWRQNLGEGTARQMTHGESSVDEPEWSPDGSQIAFLTERGDDDFHQIYLMPNDGGEAFRLAELEMRPSNLQWSPDGSFLYFTAFSAVPKEEKTLLRERKLIPRFEDPERKRQLWRIAIESQEVEALTAGEGSVGSYSLSEEGDDIFFSKAPGALIDELPAAELWSLELTSREERKLTENTFTERNPLPSPNKPLLAYLATVNEAGEEYYQQKLFLLDLESGERSLLTGEFAGEVSAFSWDAGGQGLFFLGNTGISSHLYSCSLEGGEVEALTEGDWTITEWSYFPNKKRHLFKKESATEPGDYWILEEGATDSQRITWMNEKVGERFLLPRQEVVQWKSHDGFPIEGLLTYPLDYVKGTPFPLVVQTHGGPRGTDQYGLWKSGYFEPVLAAQGYGSLRTNHRGGTGYGDDFLRDMVGGYFRNAHLDILAGIDHLIAEGLVDPDRLVKKGWSAGGHMTNKMITHTDRFQAASSGAGAVEWMSQFGETDASYLRAWWFDGKPWQKDAPIEKYMADSVIDDLWKVKTPTLIFVGEEDVRVPASQSKILFRALRDLGVETEFYVAPGEPHGFQKPSHRLFRINKELEWFERHVHGTVFEPQKFPGEE